MKKILYVILHGKIYSERYYSIKNTWGNNNDLLFYGDYENKDNGIIKVSNDFTYHSNEEKHINVLRYLNKNPDYDYEWFFFCDDDTFVNTNKLDEELLNFDSNYVHGSVIKCWGADPTLSYCSGGAGYLINYKLLEKIIIGLRNHKTGYSDVSLGISLRDMNIKNINSSLFNSQPPSNYNYDINDIKNYISFHYIKTKDEMNHFFKKI
jgi:hypothetical protein